MRKGREEKGAPGRRHSGRVEALKCLACLRSSGEPGGGGAERSKQEATSRRSGESRCFRYKCGSYSKWDENLWSALNRGLKGCSVLRGAVQSEPCF